MGLRLGLELQLGIHVPTEKLKCRWPVVLRPVRAILRLMSKSYTKCFRKKMK